MCYSCCWKERRVGHVATHSFSQLGSPPPHTGRRRSLHLRKHTTTVCSLSYRSLSRKYRLGFFLSVCQWSTLFPTFISGDVMVSYLLRLWLVQSISDAAKPTTLSEITTWDVTPVCRYEVYDGGLY